MGIKVFGFLDCQEGEAVEFCDEVFIVPSGNVGNIQESHITAGYALMKKSRKNESDFYRAPYP